MADIKKTERVLNLVSLLLKRGERPIPWREIRHAVTGYDDGGDPETLRRRFERDKRFLEGLGVEIEYVADSAAGDGYRIGRRTALGQTISLGPAELALLSAVAASAGTSDSPFARHLQSALLKIRFDGADEDGAGGALAERILPEGPKAADPRLQTLGEAVALMRAVVFDYAGARGPTSRRTVDPYGLFARARSWYLVGRCHERAAVRTFKVGRIVGPVEMAGRDEGPDFEVPADFRLEEHSRREAWSFPGGGEPFRARVAFDADRFSLVARRQDALELREGEDGSGEASFDVTDAEAFVRWILSFGAHARILEPPRLVRQFLRAVRAVLDANS